jgi:hypothetical protein
MNASNRPLSDDLLTGAREIADYCGLSVRRIRHLADRHQLPVFRRGQLLHARKHKLDEYFAGDELRPVAGSTR